MSDFNKNFFQQTPKKENDNWMTTGTGNQQNTSPFSSSLSNFPQNNTGTGFPTSQFGNQLLPITQSTPSLYNVNGSGSVPSFGSNTSNFSKPSFGTPSGQFGTTSTNPQFGTTSTNPQFGMTSTNPQFGMTSTNPQFGMTSTNPQFGMTSTNPQFGMTSTNPQFGMTSTNPQFGASQQGTQNWSPSISSTWSATSKGSKVATYSPTRAKDEMNMFSDIVDITAMKEYSSLSTDEIRKEDYEMSLIPKITNTSFLSSNSSLSGKLGTLTPTSVLSPGSGLSSSGIGFPSSVTSAFGTPTSSMSVSNFGNNTLQSSLFSQNAPKPFSPVAAPTTSPFSSSGLTFSKFGNPMQQQQTSPLTPLSTQPFTSTSTIQQSPFGSSLSSQPSLLGASTQPQKTLFNQSTDSFNSTTLNQSQHPFTASNQQVGSTTPQLQFNTASSVSPFSSSQLPNQQFGTANSATSGIFGGDNKLFNSKSGEDSTMFAPSPFSSSFQKPTPFTFGGSQQNNTTQTGSSLFNSISPFGTSTMPPQSSFQIQPSQTPNINIQMGRPNIDLSDPYLIKNINFEKMEYQKPSVKIVLPSPIFKTSRDTPFVDLKIRQPKHIHKNMLYTIPELKDINTAQSISNFIVGFEGKGRVEFLEPVMVNTLEDIEKRISIRNENVEISDPIGCGLNKKARVYIEELYPICRTTNEAIKGKADKFPEKGIQERFIYQLKNDSNKKFIDYNPDNGVYVYEVNHF
ncbi:hypothetical protein GINT2_001035 [Glugoides intestinalis]